MHLLKETICQSQASAQTRRIPLKEQVYDKRFLMRLTNSIFAEGPPQSLDCEDKPRKPQVKTAEAEVL